MSSYIQYALQIINNKKILKNNFYINVNLLVSKHLNCNFLILIIISLMSQLIYKKIEIDLK